MKGITKNKFIAKQREEISDFIEPMHKRLLLRREAKSNIIVHRFQNVLACLGTSFLRSRSCSFGCRIQQSHPKRLVELLDLSSTASSYFLTLICHYMNIMLTLDILQLIVPVNHKYFVSALTQS